MTKCDGAGDRTGRPHGAGDRTDHRAYAVPEGFASFDRLIHQRALPKDYTVAHLISVEWTPEPFDFLVWPTETDTCSTMQYSTEECLLAVSDDAKQCVDIADR